MVILEIELTLISERKKASRILKQAQKRLSTMFPGTAEYENAQSEVHNAEVNLNYTMYHPLDEKYHSLYPPSEGHTAEGDGRSGTEKATNGQAARPLLWAVVEQCMQAGTLIALRDGKLGRTIPDDRVTPVAAMAERRNHADDERPLQEGKGKSKTKPVQKDEENESDGGFFE